MTATGTRTHHHLVCKWTFNHLAKLALSVRLWNKWLWVGVQLQSYISWLIEFYSTFFFPFQLIVNIILYSILKNYAFFSFFSIVIIWKPISLLSRWIDLPNTELDKCLLVPLLKSFCAVYDHKRLWPSFV